MILTGHKPTVPKDRKIKAAIVGCGRISKNHFLSLEGLSEEIELVAICDSDPAVCESFAKEKGVRGFLSQSEMLREVPELDLVILATPSGLHPRQAIEAMRAGKHVVTEKPMATKWEDAKEMVRVSDEAGVHLMVVKQNRSNATLQLLKNAMKKDRFGKLYMVNVNVFWTRPQEYYDAADWRATWEFDGGALMNQASHYIDLLNWLIGPIESLHCYASTLARKIDVEDSAVMNIKWRSGALGSVNVTMLTYPKNLEGSITILGEKGTVRVGGVAVNEIQHWEFADEEPEDAQIKEANYETTSVYGFGHPLYYKNVVSALRGDTPPDTDGRSGLSSMEVLTAAYRSAKEGVRINFPLD